VVLEGQHLIAAMRIRRDERPAASTQFAFQRPDMQPQLLFHGKDVRLGLKDNSMLTCVIAFGRDVQSLT
jgi:hypothetical protein